MKRRGRPALTGWIDGSVKPVRPGLYERRMGNGERIYSMWNGERWLLGAGDKRTAIDGEYPSLLQSMPWRGRRYPS